MSLRRSGSSMKQVAAPAIKFRQESQLPRDVRTALNEIAHTARTKYPTSTVLSSLPPALVPNFTLAGLPSDAKPITTLNNFFQLELSKLNVLKDKDTNKFNFDSKVYEELKDVTALNQQARPNTTTALNAISKALEPFLNPAANFPYISVKKTERESVPDFNDYKKALEALTRSIGGAYVKYDFKTRQVTYDRPLQEIATLFAKVIAQNLHNPQAKNQMKVHLMKIVNDALLASTVESKVTQMAERITPSVAHFFVLISQKLNELKLDGIPTLFPELKNEPVAEPLQILTTKASRPVRTLEDALSAKALGVSVSGALPIALLGHKIDDQSLVVSTLEKNGFTLEMFNQRIAELEAKGLMVSKAPINQVMAFLTEKGVLTAPPLSEHVQPNRLFKNGVINPMFKASIINGTIKISDQLLTLLKTDAFKTQGKYQLNYLKNEAGDLFVFPNLWSNKEDPLDADNLISHDAVALAALAAGDLIIDPNGYALMITSRSAHFCAQDSIKAADLAQSAFPNIPFRDINWANQAAYEQSPKVLRPAEFKQLDDKIKANT